MQTNPDIRFEKALNEKTPEQLIKEIKVFKREVERLKHVIEEEPDNPENSILLSPQTQIRVYRDYLKHLFEAYKKAGGEYVPTKAELESLESNESLTYLQSIRLSLRIAGLTYVERIFVIDGSEVVLKINDTADFSSEEKYSKDEFLSKIADFYIGEWKKRYSGNVQKDGIRWDLEFNYIDECDPVKYTCLNAYPYNFKEFAALFQVY